MGRSNPDPVLRRTPGARFTTTLLAGSEKPHERSAAFTRSRDSCTEASARPTMEKPGIPFAMTTSTSTGTASTPRSVADRTTHCPRTLIGLRTR